MSGDGPYAALARFVLAHRGATGAFLVVLVLVSALIGLPPEIEPNLLALLPPEEPAARALQELERDEGGTNLVTLAFEADDPAKLEPFLTELGAALERSERVRFAMHTIDPELGARIGVLQLDPADVHELAARMKGALALGPALNPMLTQRLMSMGPVTERIEKASDPSLLPGMAPGSGRMLVRPTGSSKDNAFARALMAELEQTLEAELASHPGVRSKWIGGAYRHNVEDYEGINQDLLWTSGASVLLVLGVIALSFRSLRAIVLVMLPLLGANVVTLAAVRLTLGSLNTYTSFGTAILVGLGIDFAVHLTLRYRELRALGLGVETAIVTAWERVGPPSLTAALTSAAGFVALSVAQFRGFSQLGMLLAIGLLVSLAMMLIALPLLIPVLDPNPPAPRGSGPDPAQSRSTYVVAPGLLMALVLVTAFAGASRIPRLEWEHDVSALRRDGLSYAELGDEERALARESYAPVIVRFPTEEARREAQVRVEEKIAHGDLPHVARVLSIDTLLPTDQDARLAALADLQGLLAHPNLRYLPPPLVQRLIGLKDVPLAPMDRADLPESLRFVLGAGGADDHRLVVLAKGNMWDMEEAAALEAELRPLFPVGAAAGEYVALGALYRTMQRDLPIVGGLAFLLVALLTAIDLKRPNRIATALGTLVAGLMWAGVALQVAGVKLTMINVVGVPILLGIGIDVVIHLLHRLAEEGPGGVRRALRTTGLAATLSTLTTVLSFCSLILAGNRGVRSMGLLVVIGLSVVFVASAIVLPTAWAAGWRVSGRAPGQNRDD